MSKKAKKKSQSKEKQSGFSKWIKSLEGKITVAAAAAIIVGVCAYVIFAPGPRIKRAVGSLFEGIKNFDVDAVEEMLTDVSVDDYGVYYWGLDDEKYDAYDYLQRKIKSSGMFVKYAASKISWSVTYSGPDRASVKVRYLDLGDFVPAVFDIYRTYAVTSRLEDIDALEKEEIFDGIMVKMIADGYHFSFKETTVELRAVMTDGRYKIAEFPELSDIAFGELLSDPEKLISDIDNAYDIN